MLKDLEILSVSPQNPIMRMLAESIHGINLSDESSYFKHYQIGVYLNDAYKFNFDSFIYDNPANFMRNESVAYGVCDDYKQVLEHYKDLLNDLDKNYVIGLSSVKRSDEPETGGWRWHKWGPYIGTQNPQHEYLYDDTHIDVVYCYHIYEIA